MDPRHVDWRVLGRRDKLYVKQYEEETSLRCYLLLDKSASMGYKSDGAAMSKLEYASFLAATLAYLAAFQHDAAGLVTFDGRVRDQIPARQGPGHLRVLMQKLEQTQAGEETSLAGVFHELAESLKRRALVVILSDLFDDPAEVTFPFDDVTRIEDMETRREITSDPRAFRKAYLDEFNRFLDAIRGGCRAANIDHTTAQTDRRLDQFLGAYLARRQAMTH